MNLIKIMVVAELIFGLGVPALQAAGPMSNANQISNPSQRRQAVKKINPAVVYVNQASRADCPDGSSWAMAFPSLTQALKSNLTGKKEIWVARGTYYPSENGQRADSFTLVSGISVYGGFLGKELIRTQRDWRGNITILSGEIGDPTLLSDNAYHVVTGADDTVLDGFVIRDGYALPGEGESDDSGCLLRVPKDVSNTKALAGMTNIKNSSGGGLLNLYAATHVRNCQFLNNYAVRGAAVYNLTTRFWDPESMEKTVQGAIPVFESCIFEGNHATEAGGAVSNDYFTRSTFVNCIFANNLSDAKGGAVYADHGSPVYLMNVLFSNNAAERGAALVAEGGSSHRLLFATFTCNMAYDTGAALYQGGYAGEQIDGAPFMGNEVHLYHSLVISNVSISSPSSISNWHDSTVTFDVDSVVETVDGTINPGQYLAEKTLASKSPDAGFHPARKLDVAYWTDIFDGDENRTYRRCGYDTSSPAGITGTIYVNAAAAPGGDGTSWSAALKDLTLALEQAVSGSQVWVAKGVYTPTEGVDRSAAFVMKEGVRIYGGFSGTETTLEERYWAANPTVLCGDINEPGEASDNSYHVVFGARDSLLDGFIIQNGMADGDFDHSRGGGLLCSAQGSPKIVNCTFDNNRADEGGAIACVGYAAPVLENCRISGNNARFGGGILFRTRPDNQGPGASLVDVQLIGNRAEGRGGGVYIDFGARPGFTRCTLSGNRSTGNGGGVYANNNASLLTDNRADFTACFVKENTTGLRGGAFAIYEGAVRLKNTVVSHNTAVAGGGGIAIDYRGSVINDKNSSLIQENISASGKTDIDNACQI